MPPPSYQTIAPTWIIPTDLDNLISYMTKDGIWTPPQAIPLYLIPCAIKYGGLYPLRDSFHQSRGNQTQLNMLESIPYAIQSIKFCETKITDNFQTRRHSQQITVE